MINTIILTWTIQIVWQVDHKIKSTTLRLQQYITNITKYIIDSPFNQIIFCENSNYNISSEREILESLAKFYHKKIELIQFKWDTDRTNLQGRGYGESEIMEYALQKSKLIFDDQPIIKITWRYYLSNSCEFVNYNHKKNMFIRMSPMKPRCSTACYIFTPSFYREHLWWIGEKVDDKKGKNSMLEWVFYHQLSQKTHLIETFRVLPKLQAITWSWYVLQSKYWTDKIKNILLNLWLYKI